MNVFPYLQPLVIALFVIALAVVPVALMRRNRRRADVRPHLGETIPGRDKDQEHCEGF